MTKADGVQQHNNQPMKGSAKAGGGGGGDSDSDGSGNNGNATAQWQQNGNGDGRQWTVWRQRDGNDSNGRCEGNATAT
jgi:hypothetical protein